MSRLTPITLLAATLALAGCQTVPSGANAPKSPAGIAYSGESCASTPRRGQAEVLELFCGNTSRAVGAAQMLGDIRNIPTDEAERRKHLTKALEESAPMRTLGQRATCRTPDWVGTIENLMAAVCTLKDGGLALYRVGDGAGKQACRR